MDVEPPDQAAIGRRTEDTASPKQSLGRNSPLRHPGRLRGQGRRGYWVGKRAQQVQGRIKSTKKGATVKLDSKDSRNNGAQGDEFWVEAGTRTDVTTVLPLGTDQLRD